MKTLELHYLMIHFLLINNKIPWARGEYEMTDSQWGA